MVSIRAGLLPLTQVHHTRSAVSQHPHPDACFPPKCRAAQLGALADAGGDAKELGRKFSCIFNNWLWYFDWQDGFPVPIVHALSHNVFGAFLAFALRKLSDGDNRETIISRASRKVIAERSHQLLATMDMGRSYKCIIKHLGSYTFEVALVYGEFVLRGDVLPAQLRRMCDFLVAAMRHYLTFDSFTAGARAAARTALRNYAAEVEREPEMAKALLTPSLHVLICRWVGYH